MGTREDIVRAAAAIMRGQGYAHATTKEIARAAGYSEAALYKHFRDKTEIFVSVLMDELPGLTDRLDELAEGVGTRTVRANLATLARTATEFYREAFPIAASVFSTQHLLTAHRQRMDEQGAGPHYPHTKLAEYLRAEQRIGRLRRGADPAALASLLLGACFQQAFLLNFAGDTDPASGLDKWCGNLVRTLLDPARPN